MDDHSRPLRVFGLQSGDPASAVWEALFADAGCGVAVLGADGVVTECNGSLAWMLGASAPAALLGARLDCHLRGAAEAHAEALCLVLGDQGPVAVDGPVGDLFTRSTYRPARGRGGEVLAVLVTIAMIAPNAAVPHDVYVLRVPRPGALGSLTIRETEVLSAIGRGLSTAEIAEELSRSTKTVEGHRGSLGIKLGVSNRVQLARIAIRSGLAPLHDRMVEPKPAVPAPTADGR